MTAFRCWAHQQESLRGFNVINDRQAALEAACPNVVRAPDIVAFAARDASFFLSNGRISFSIPSGPSRRPRVPCPTRPPALSPGPFSDLETLKTVRRQGARHQRHGHASGRAHRRPSSLRLRRRLQRRRRPGMNATLAGELSRKCAAARGDTPDVLDGQYTRTSTETAALVDTYAAAAAAAAGVGSGWEMAFAAAMVKTRPGADAEIRRRTYNNNRRRSLIELRCNVRRRKSRRGTDMPATTCATAFSPSRPAAINGAQSTGAEHTRSSITRPPVARNISTQDRYGGHNKLGALVTLLGLLGSVACQAGYSISYPAPSQSSTPSDSNIVSAICMGGSHSWPPVLKLIPQQALAFPFLLFPHQGRPVGSARTTTARRSPYCPGAEAIVRKVVEKAIGFKRGIGAGLIRLFFHDCFVQNTTGSSEETEMFGLPNINSLRGFDVIDEAKAELERSCPRKVSCADIVAFAARDAARNLSNGAIDFAMPAGRLDGRVPFDELDDLKKGFSDQGLDEHDLVHRPSTLQVLREPPATAQPFGHGAGLAGRLNATCTEEGDDFHVAQDPETPVVLDSQYYRNVRTGGVLFTSDDALNSTDATRKLVKSFAESTSFE
ncbi:hypothetical protein HU200_005161 [Digitaria exilis]|uniref:Plant heme peroxidase family profile domain-containing protein n=1 Tax=Digitaria exilis TaxID=1010633 RepID=A0A835FR56_9POAL|nr:hypothetical protein HU200_005161 [Digitaria exilis]